MTEDSRLGLFDTFNSLLKDSETDAASVQPTSERHESRNDRNTEHDTVTAHNLDNPDTMPLDLSITRTVKTCLTTSEHTSTQQVASEKTVTDTPLVDKQIPTCVLNKQPDKTVKAMRRQHTKAKLKGSVQPCKCIDHELFQLLKLKPNDVRQRDMRRKVSKLFTLIEAPHYCLQYNRDKVKGLWASRPADWPADLAFRDPNNGLKNYPHLPGSHREKCQKPKKDELRRYWSHLRQKFLLTKWAYIHCDYEDPMLKKESSITALPKQLDRPESDVTAMQNAYCYTS